MKKPLTILGLISLGVSVIMLLAIEGIFALWACAFFLLLGIILIFGKKFIIADSMKTQLKRIKKEGKLPFGKIVKVHFDEKNLHETSEVAETKVNYHNVEKIAEGSHAIYIYISAMQAFILPHRTFESEQQKTEFLFFIKGKVSIK